MTIGAVFLRITMKMCARNKIFFGLLMFIGLPALLCGAQPSQKLPGLQEAVLSKQDVYGNAALEQSNGPSYEFFHALIPSLHYVNADFAHYPLVLSAPSATRKSRLVANGSAINARANTRAWNDFSAPALFRVGNDELAFGEYLQRLDGPKFADGWLPIVQFTYHHGAGEYFQETFASVEPSLASNAVSLTRFTYKAREKDESNGRMVVRFDTQEPLKAEQGRILNGKGEVLAWFDSKWKWMAGRRVLEATLKNGAQAAIAVSTIPSSATIASPLDSGGFDAQRQQCVETWSGILNRGMNIEVPEPYVNNAWRSLLVANFALINGDKMYYSAGNGYDKLYEQEGGEAALALMQYGYEDDMRRLLPPLLDFTRKGLEFHQAGHKLDDICQYYWQTRDANFVNELRPRWQKEVDRLANHRSDANGLYPREQYCGDIATPVFSMNSNAKGWRALRDSAALLDALGDKTEAEHLRKICDDFRKDILAAADKSVRKDSDAAFVPNALLGEEQPYDFITATKLGSYWNLMANDILATEVFGQQSELETGMCRYFQEHGGLFMGLTRSRPWPAFWVSSANMNPLYGWYYVRTLLRRDEPDRALVSFYGMLAAGLTTDTFVCGEGCSIEPVDQWGRQFYLPPNSAGNAFFLQMLRNLLVQDWDLNED
ncbi:MAG TPA: hypothetical protein VG754_04385, partial [Verrucomicrobiae bacterium]|nr:hypothetical protein [Verrucomicrobiae bacterium]